MPTPSDPVAFWSETVIVVAAAFVLTVVLTRWLIGWLTAHQFGKAIRADGPAHEAKAGTPTMGGLGMLGVIAAGGLYVAWRLETPYPLVVLLAMVVFGALGLIDDLHGLARRSGGRELGVGMTARRMFALQMLAGAAICVPITWHVAPGASPVARLAGGLVSAVGLVAVVNGVNISDGLDGLAAGLCAIAFGALAWAGGLGAAWSYSYRTAGADYGSAPVTGTDAASVVLPFVFLAACMGFLVYNRHPARVFMGNVTSMALGAGLALSFALGPYLPNPDHAGFVDLVFWITGFAIFGLMFYVELASDVLQVAYFKLTGGRRLFRMAPLHHHFELSGWHETRVVKWFWLAAAILPVLYLTWLSVTMLMWFASYP